MPGVGIFAALPRKRNALDVPMKDPIAQIAAGTALLLALTTSSSLMAQTPPQGSQAQQMHDQMMPGMMRSPGMMGGGMMGGGGPMNGMMMQGREAMGMGDCPMMGGDVGTHAAGRVAFLKAELAITDQQKDAWDAYAAALKKALEGMQNMHATMMTMMQAKSPVERLDARIAAMDSRLTALKELKPPLANLYAVLSDDQKKKADELMGGMGSMM